MTNFDRAVGRMNRRKGQIIAPSIPLPTPARRDQPASAELHALAASANRIDMIIAVFALGVILGALIA